jgi:hypothetical protein
MPQTVALGAVLPLAACTRDDFNNWRRRGIYRSSLPETRKGVPQELGRNNALELAFLAAIIRAGFDPLDAKIEVSRWIKELSAGKLAPAWVANPRRKRTSTAAALGLGFGTFNETNIYAVAGISGLNDAGPGDESGWNDEAPKQVPPAAVLVFVNRAEIIRRIDNLFTADAKERS